MISVVTVQSRVRVDLVWDESLQRWDFDVPSMNILGSGGATREDALRRATEAIAFALDSGDTPESQPGEEVAYVPIAVGG